MQHKPWREPCQRRGTPCRPYFPLQIRTRAQLVSESLTSLGLCPPDTGKRRHEGRASDTRQIHTAKERRGLEQESERTCRNTVRTLSKTQGCPFAGVQSEGNLRKQETRPRTGQAEASRLVRKGK